ncbi:MAG: tripartite tricarboxylate transporter substrate binding protein, partial [Betaproteobacteria bacterium]|nr:tripartite tricarboxylate transporter substrate binding protein [Betaproteobacteria bacterium]
IKAVGGDVRKAKLVSFKSAPDAISALLGGHVDMVVTNAANATPFMQSGDVRVVASSSPRRLAGPYANVPTWREQGIDVVLIGWRAVIGPRGMSEDQVAFWDSVFAKLSKTEEWNKFLEDDLRENIYMGGKESRDFMRDDYQKLRAIFSELGLAAGR